MNAKAIENFCTYLQIDTSHPNPQYLNAVNFLKNQAEELKLEFKVIELSVNNPIVILKWNGKYPNRKSVVLNSHMDVVPVFREKWKYSPFSAYIDENENIYARGSQDMKSVGSQYLEAIRRIKFKLPNYIPNRNIFITFVPDEEMGSLKGMKLFVENDYCQKMNIGVFMDEGITSCTDEYPVFYGERIAWWLRIKIFGDTGHGSQFIENSAGMKLRKFLDRFMDFRDFEENRMKENDLTLGDVTTINLTGIEGGVQPNVVPDTFTLQCDVRITPTVDLKQFQNMLDEWASHAGGGIEYEIFQQSPLSPFTCIDLSNKWWTTFENVCQSFDMKIKPQIFPAGTDSRFLRRKGVSSIGFSPINKTPVLLHDHNEFININTFIFGIGFYERLIPSLAEVKEE